MGLRVMHYRRDLGEFLNRLGLTGRGAVVGAPRDDRPGILGGWTGEPARVVPADAPPEAAGTGGLDFVYLNHYATDTGGSFRYGAAREALRRWYPEARPGGVLAGHGYCDPIHDGEVFGVRSAVQEFAREVGDAQVRVTMDDVPTWFFVAGSAPAPPASRFAVLTGHDGNQSELAGLSTPNKRRYCDRHGYDFIELTGGFDPSRPPAWSKIKFLRERLETGRYDWLFWTDVDSLVMDGSQPLGRVTGPAEGYDVVISHEDLGQGVYNVNSGQWLVRDSDWSRQFLDEVWAQTQFPNDRLWENRAIIHLLYKYDLSERVQIVTQRRLNSYPTNYRKGDFLLHFPRYPLDQRLALMRLHEQFAEP